MIVLSGADLVLSDRVIAHGTVTLDAGRITEISDSPPPTSSASIVDCRGFTIVPGLIDAHVHGVEGVDTLDDGEAVAHIAAALPRYGVTTFCPTTVACGPEELRRMLEQVRGARVSGAPGSARVLGAHLESNFISAEYCGAQPATCIRTWMTSNAAASADSSATTRQAAFTTEELRDTIDACAADIATVTLAPETNGGMELIAWLVQRGIRVSLGHSAADAAVTLEAIAHGACQVTHLFNAMRPMHHRRPGLAGIALGRPELAAEVICDGVHVHPAMVRLVLAAKGASRMLAVSDATAAAGLSVGQTARLGGREIRATDRCAQLADGTMAGSTTTLDRAFYRLTREMQVSMIDAVHLCATTPARELGLHDRGVLAEGTVADLAVFDADGQLVQTYISGTLVFSRIASPGNSLRTTSV